MDNVTATTAERTMAADPNAGVDPPLDFASRWRSTVEVYHNVMENYSDKRVRNWFLMSGPGPTLLACTIYVICMKFIGPRLMRNRKPFELKRVMIIYNIFQMLFNLWIVSMGVESWLFEYSIFCQPVDYSDRPQAVRMVNAAWWFYFSKFIDWFDTLFFVMRKKFEHLSVLHLVHHGLMPFSIWWGVKFCGGGQSTFFGLLNTQVHIIMYLYYSLAALGPKYQKYLWWKKYLTTIQLLQFAAVLIHALQLFFIECNYPKVFVYAIIVHALLFIGLFTDFYIKTYVKKKPKVKVESDVKNGALTNGSAKISKTSSNGTQEHDGATRRRKGAASTGKDDDVNAGSRVSLGHNGMCIHQGFYDAL